LLDRRGFILGSISILHSAACLAPSQAAPAGGSARFICGTLDRFGATRQGFTIAPFSSDPNYDRKEREAITNEFHITPFGTALYSNRWRSNDGMTPNSGLITLGICFLNGTDSQRALVRAASVKWLTGELGTKMKFAFDVPRDKSQITISFNNSSLNRSLVGRESAQYANKQATMDLGDLIDHVIEHEFGHVLGLEHEHSNPAAPIQWNKQQVIDDMMQQGWSEQDVEENIFARFNKDYACVGDPAFDKDSIMLYPFSENWTLNHFSSAVNTMISERDVRCVTSLYRS